MVNPIGERGLLDLKFDPEHETNGFFYVAYNQAGTLDMMIARYGVSAGPNVADPDSEVILKSITDYVGHNGGQLQFGPNDGLLYFGAGDGSTPQENDPENNAQSLLSLHGKILRLDPHAPPAYIPPTNPFVGNPDALDEIWASGLRQPWRFSFDRMTGDMYIGEVGRNLFEEIDFQPAADAGGRNYGWKCLEGPACTGFGGCDCADLALIPPILAIERGLGDGTCAVIGGSVYRGTAIPELVGRYVYSDHCGRYFRSFVLVPDGGAGGGGVVVDEQEHTEQLNPLDDIRLITSFGEDPAGELYVASKQGSVWEIVPLAEADCNDNGIADRVEVDGGQSPDCNENGHPDGCDITSGWSQDCNGNGTPDECEFGIEIELASPVLSPIGNGAPQSHTLPSPPEALAGVEFIVSASTDLNADHEWLDLLINGNLVGTVFQDEGVSCPPRPDVNRFTLDPEVFNQAVAGGDAETTVVASTNVSATECDDSFVSFIVRYVVLDPAIDLNDSGVPDPCECLADTNGDGTVDVTDLINVILAWGQAKSEADVNFDGIVDVQDLVAVILAWGTCT
jgi:hypothetical protein